MTTVDLSDPPVRSGRGRAVVVWTAITLLYTTVLYLQVPLPLAQALASAAVYCYTLGLLSIPVRRWSARLLRAGSPVWITIVTHVAIGIGIIAAWQGICALFYWIVIGPDFWRDVYAGSWMFQLLSAVVIYIAMLGLTLFSLTLARDRERTEREHALEMSARDAQLMALRAQFQPHFILNALNSLLALIDRDPALARTMVVRLADLMKSVFDREQMAFVPLERELDLVRAYLDVERIRLGPRLAVGFDIHDAARGVLVPPFLLQPVVENAVKHGVAPFAGPGRVDVSASVEANRLRLVVRDSAGTRDCPASVAAGTGRGLQITRSRLNGAYGASYEMTFVPAAEGAAVEICIPLEHSGAA